MVTFTVVGTPKPQGSKRAYINRKTGRPIITEQGGSQLTDWRTDVQQAAIRAQGDTPPLEGPLTVKLHFYLQRPKSHPKTKITWPITRPDIDKLARAVLDAITYVCFKDDSQVVVLYVTKTWAEANRGVTVTIEEVW